MIYGSKYGKYWFSYIFHCNFTTMVSAKVKLWFLSSLEHFWPDPWDTLSEVALFFEKMHKVFKNKAQGCSTPLIKKMRHLLIELGLNMIFKKFQAFSAFLTQTCFFVTFVYPRFFYTKKVIFLPFFSKNWHF